MSRDEQRWLLRAIVSIVIIALAAQGLADVVQTVVSMVR